MDATLSSTAGAAHAARPPRNAPISREESARLLASMAEAGRALLGAAPVDEAGLSWERHAHLGRHAVSRLGDILVERCLITDDELRLALEAQSREAHTGHWVMLGQVLSRLGLTTSEDIDAAILKLAQRNEREHFSWAFHPSVTSPAKRLVDVAGALAGLTLTALVLPVAALAISLEDDGPVLFKQHRVGLHGYQFPIWKIRTMVPDADRLKLGVKSRNALFFSAPEDRRVTLVGAVLRKTMLDELPQFWNVLLGQMSLVGTRPPTLDEVSHYSDEHWRRLEVKPGLTGLWQATPGRHAHSFEDVIALDRQYRDTWSVWLDLQIIARTAALVLEKLVRR